MAELERLWVRVLGDVQDLDKKLNTAQRRVLRFGDQMRSVGKGLTLGLSVPLAAAGTVAVTAAADMDRLRRGLLAVAGSTAEAQAQLDRLRRVARAPGLGFREAIQGSIRLQAAFGDMPGRAKLAEDALRAFGNAIATVGGGKAELDRVSLALAQIAARGKVSAEEINQLSEAVPQIRQAMQAAFGTADTEVLQRRGIGAEEFIRGLVDELLKLPQVTGGAANAFENFGDALFRARAAAGEAMLPAVTELTAGLADMLEEVEGLDPRLLRVGIAFGAALAVAGPLTVAIGALTTAVTALAAAGASLTVAFLGPAALVAGLGAVVALFVKAKLEAAAFRGELEQLRQSAAGGIDPTLDRAQLAALARGRREALLMLQRRRDEILAVASARHGRPVTIDNPNLPALLTSDEEQELRDVQRAIAATEASLAALFARFKELGERSNEAADGVSAFLEAMDRTVAFTRGALAASMPPDTLASAIERSGFRGLGVPLSPLTTSSFGAAQEMVRRFIDAGISFDRLPAEIQDAIRKAFADRAEVAASFQAATGQGGGALGNLGAFLTGVGGIVGGQAGGVLSGLGGGLTALLTATNPVVAGLGAFGGALTALRAVLDGAPSAVEKVRAAFARTLDWLSAKFDLLDTPAREQFEELKRLLADQLGGPLAQLLEQTTPDSVEAFIAAATAELDRLIALRNAIGQTDDIDQRLKLLEQFEDQWAAVFGALSVSQVEEFLRGIKAAAREMEESIRSALFNVPKGFKIALERFRATEGIVPAASSSGPIGSAPGRTDPGAVVPRGGDTFIIHINGANKDGRTLWQEIQREIQRDRSRGGVNRLNVAFAR